MKKLVSYTVSKDVLADFDKLAKEKAVNKSALIELFMKEWIQKNTCNDRSTKIFEKILRKE